MRKSIVFYNVHKPQHASIIKQTVRAGFLPIITGKSVHAELVQAGIEMRQWETVARSRINETTNNVLARMSEQVAAHLQSAQLLEQAFGAEGMPFLSATGVDFAEKLVISLSQEITAIERLKAFRERYDIRLIVLGCDNSADERALVLYARELGIPTLQLAHGFYGKVKRGQTAGNMHALYSDYIAVFGQREMACLTENGIAPDRILVTGAPHWDTLYSPRAQISRQEARAKLKLPEHSLVMLVCTSYVDGSSLHFSHCTQLLYEQFEQVCRTVLEINGPVEIMLRPHPHELLRATASQEVSGKTDEMFAAWLARKGIKNVRILRQNKLEAVRAADLVVTLGMTSITPEIMILQRPVLAWPWDPDASLEPLDASSGIVLARDKADFTNQLNRLMTNESARLATVEAQNRALPELNHNHDGRATERVTELILKLAGGAEKEPVASTQTEQQDGDKMGLRILQVVHDFPPQAFSGTELYTLHLSQELQKLGHHVSVIYPTSLPETPPYTFWHDIYDGIEVFRFNIDDGRAGSRSDFLNSNYDQPFRAFLQHHDFDIVHFQHLYGLSANWLQIAKDAGLPVFLKIDDMFWYCRQVHLMQGGKNYCSGPDSVQKCIDCMRTDTPDTNIADEHLTSYFLLREATLQNAFKQADFVHSPSQFLKTTYLAAGCTNDEFHVIPTGIRPFEPKQRQRPRKPVRVAFVGEIHTRKGIHHFLQAVELTLTTLHNKAAADSIRFMVYGNHFNDDLYRSMCNLIDRRGGIEYRGGFSPADRPNVLAEIDVLVMPSLGENYPFILREAHYAGVPVIATCIAGVPEIVHHGKNGWLIQPADVAALARIFVDIAQTPQQLRSLAPDPRDIRLIAEEAQELARWYGRKRMTSEPVATARIETMYHKAEKLIADGQVRQGLHILSDVLNLAPRHRATLRLLSRVYRLLGKHQEAEAMLELAKM